MLVWYKKSSFTRVPTNSRSKSDPVGETKEPDAEPSHKGMAFGSANGIPTHQGGNPMEQQSRLVVTRVLVRAALILMALAAFALAAGAPFCFGCN